MNKATNTEKTTKTTEKTIVGSIWTKTAKSGVVYNTAVINVDVKKGTNLVIFENKTKKQTNSPDYFIFESNSVKE